MATKRTQNNKGPVETQEMDYEWKFAKSRDRIARSKWDQFLRNVYNKDKGKFLGRTLKEWWRLFIFYVVFFTCLAIFFALCMKGLMYSVNEKVPRWILDESLIGTNPGLGFRPLPTNNGDGVATIWITPSNQSNVDQWMANIDSFTQSYRDAPNKGVWCDYDKPPLPGKLCAVDLDDPSWGNCTRSNHYGFHSASPCIFLKLNKIYGWVPVYYNDTRELPESMPEDLKAHIRKVGNADPKKLDNVWISCHGDGPADRENIGPLEFFPQPGFPGYYYPYTNQEGYLSPLIAVQFKRPKVNSLINIECRTWAKNTFYYRRAEERAGSVHFELMVDT